METDFGDFELNCLIGVRVCLCVHLRRSTMSGGMVSRVAAGSTGARQASAQDYFFSFLFSSLADYLTPL